MCPVTCMRSQDTCAWWSFASIPGDTTPSGLDPIVWKGEDLAQPSTQRSSSSG